MAGRGKLWKTLRDDDCVHNQDCSRQCGAETGNNFERFKDKLLHSDFKGKGNISQSRLEDATRIATKNLLLGFYGEDASVDVTIEVLIWINCRDVAAKLREEREKDLGLNEKISEMSIEDYRVKYKEHIHREYQQIKDRNSRLGEGTLLNSRYTKLIIVNQYRPEKEREHEIMAMGQRHAEIMNEQARSSITINTLFRPERDAQAPRLVALVGAAGIGKTMTALKIMLDWATGKLYKKQFDYVYYINCKEMTLLTQERSVADMILKSYPTNKAPIEHILANPEKILFVIDGFDELRFAFDQPESDLCSDPRKKQSVEIILNSLFRRTVLPECHLIITTRPTALGKLEKCSKCFRYAEILGFSEKERREYFQNFFENEKEASDAFNFVSKNEILFTMCFVPIVSWIICTVLKQQMDRGKDLAQTSKTITGHQDKEFLWLVKWFYQGKQKHSSVYPLCQALKDPDCKIKKLHFQFCKLKGTCCRDLAAVFSNNWHLKELKLYKSDLGYFGLKQLCEGLKQPDCKLQSLHFKDLARSGCRDLAAVLSTSPSLTQLELNSDLRDSGVQQLCQGLKNPNCKLQRLKLESCGFTSTGCRNLRTVLRSNWSLRELELSGNHVGDLGAEQLCEGLKDPSCHLQRLELRYCGFSAACCEDFAHVLINNPSLITLDLRGNHLGDSGVQNLCMWLKHPNCQLQKLW
ncbi:hypothetical protein Y1Q_0006369 [Alligator mississippiensis]|uniref:NACHT, LRR and PYD domains-containing protein 3 n=1 Tax=Alligator mississippiensis TaxID=8496 RepID=A0A151NXK3_ALLMI|nr:hypothetical protein Y1Q_0006369 [Alligator mississippiensis]